MRRLSDLSMERFSSSSGFSTIGNPFSRPREKGFHAQEEESAHKLRRQVRDRGRVQRGRVLPGDRPETRGVANDGVEQGEAKQGVLQAQGDAREGAVALLEVPRLRQSHALPPFAPHKPQPASAAARSAAGTSAGSSAYACKQRERARSSARSARQARALHAREGALCRI